MALIIHSSRSRYESFMKCPRMGYLQYHYRGRGIVREGKNLFLATGTWVHVGLEKIGKWLKDHKGSQEVPEDTLGWIISQAVGGFFNDVFKNGAGFNLSLYGMDEGGERREFSELELIQQQQYTFDEQSALVEALLRIFCLRIVPKWMKQYRIVMVENDMSFPFAKGEGFEVIQSARVDWVLQEIETKDLYLVSFKSSRTWDQNTAKIASHDFQGLSESWAFDEYLRAKNIDKRIMGVKMLYLIKGARKETKRGSGIYEQNSPLIRGYRKMGFEGPEYAHSWFFPNPKNESGIGALGKAWEKFDVFSGIGLQEVGGVKGWIEKLENGQVQAECGDILGEQIVEPEAYARHQRDIDSWLLQTVAREVEIGKKLILEASPLGEFLDESFPQNRQACHYYPGDVNDCPYIPICFGTEEERLNPLRNGFVWRTPHHKAELIQI